MANKRGREIEMTDQRRSLEMRWVIDKHQSCHGQNQDLNLVGNKT